MSIKDAFKRLCFDLGKNNSPEYAVVAIATVKGIARPTITMMDKKEDPQTKKYTALREGLTEVVAIPTYITCGYLAGKLGGKLNLAPDQKSAAVKNFKFLGVCLAALLVIPALASVTIKPFMKKIQEKKIDELEDLDDLFDKDDEHKLDIKEKSEDIAVLNKPVFKSTKPVTQHINGVYMPNKLSGNMRVGGLW